jgi:hypothetical protein
VGKVQIPLLTENNFQNFQETNLKTFKSRLFLTAPLTAEVMYAELRKWQAEYNAKLTLVNMLLFNPGMRLPFLEDRRLGWPQSRSGDSPSAGSGTPDIQTINSVDF